MLKTTFRYKKNYKNIRASNYEIVISAAIVTALVCGQVVGYIGYERKNKVKLAVRQFKII